MKHAFTRWVSTAALACVGLLGAVCASAQGTWTGAGSGSTCNPGVESSASVACNKGSLTATMTAWGYFGSGLTTTGWTAGRVGDFDTNGLGVYSGKNESGTDNQHAFDNVTSACGSTVVSGNTGLNTANSGCGGTIEGLLVSFTNISGGAAARVNMSQVSVGWKSGDADLSVYRWNGALSGPTMGTQTVNSSTGAMAGWALVGSNDMLVGTPFNTAGTQYSSHFMITTYFGATSGGLDALNDRFKLNSFTANSCSGTLNSGNNGASCVSVLPVPEPSSLALVSVALLGAYRIRRRRVAQA